MKVIRENHRRNAESRNGTGVGSLSSKRTSVNNKQQYHDITAIPKNDGPSQAIKAMNAALAKAAQVQPVKKQALQPSSNTGIAEDPLARFADSSNNEEEAYGQEAPTRILKSNAYANRNTNVPTNDTKAGPIASRHIKIQEIVNADSNSGSKNELNMGSNDASRIKSAKVGIKQRMAAARSKGIASDATLEDELAGGDAREEQIDAEEY